MSGRLDAEKLMGWLRDPEVMKSRKRQYYTLLGICGNKQHIPFLEEVIRSGDRDRQSGLDALIACYLTLAGDDGIALVEETFLANPKAEYIDVFSAIAALRFHGTEGDRVSRESIVGALRHVLDRPKMADMVIPDLARWEDWSVMERLVTMYKEANTDDTKWVRTPIISYLQACPKPEAAGHIDELRVIDPEAVAAAEMLAELDWDDDDGWGDDQQTGENTTDNQVDEPPTAKPSSDAGDGNRKMDDNGETAPSETNAHGPPNAGEPSPAVVAFKPVLPGDPGALDPDRPIPRNQDMNRSAASYVSTSGSAVTSADRNAGVPAEQLAQSAPTTSSPVATVIPVNPSSSLMILTAFLICVLLFALLWSVLNGWFERLIF